MLSEEEIWGVSMMTEWDLRFAMRAKTRAAEREILVSYEGGPEVIRERPPVQFAVSLSSPRT